MSNSAHVLVAEAILCGVLPSPRTLQCARCSNSAVLYHHPNGYEPPHQLDVEPLCSSCHSLQHKPNVAPGTVVTNEDLELVAVLREKFSLAEIGAVLGVSRQTLDRRLKLRSRRIKLALDKNLVL